MFAWQAVGKEPNFISVPIGLFDVIIGAIDFFANLGLKGAKDAAELARIGGSAILTNTQPSSRVESDQPPMAQASRHAAAGEKAAGLTT